MFHFVALFALAAAVACTPDPEDEKDRSASEPKTSAGCQRDATRQKQQMRGSWIASVKNINWPSRPGLSAKQQRDELVRWFDDARAKRLNTVMLQVRPSGDTFWPSRYEPWSQWLSGKQGEDPGYDPLAFAVEEAHERNLHLHAWFNPYRASATPNPKKLTSDHPARQHPDWVFRYDDSLYYDPGVPEARRHVEDTVMEVVRRYDIDGVHFDDYFYPYPLPKKKIDDGATYKKYRGRFDDVADWRRNNVDTLVRELSQRIHRAKPWVQFGISPFGIWKNKTSDPAGSDTKGLESYHAIYADTRTWVKNRWVDYIAPQLYWYVGFDVADYAKLVPWWAEQVRGTGVRLYIGQAAYKLGTEKPWRKSDELSRHLTLNQRYREVSGDLYFSAKSVRDDPVGGVSRLVDDHYRRPAFTPAQRGGARPSPPTVTAAAASDKGVTVRWRDGTGKAPTSYAVYRFDGKRASACGFADATHLVTTQHRAGNGEQSFTDTTAAAGKTYTYYVTSLDRMSTESKAGKGRTIG